MIIISHEIETRFVFDFELRLSFKPFFWVEWDAHVSAAKSPARILDFQLNCNRTGLAGVRARELDRQIKVVSLSFFLLSSIVEHWRQKELKLSRGT